MLASKGYTPHNRTSQNQLENRQNLYDLYEQSPLSTDQMLINMGLYMRSSALARLLWIDELYRQIIDIPGALMEFGVWWGQTLTLLKNFLAIHEPYNHSRRIIGFDTFQGYPTLSEKDVKSETIKVGSYTVTENYEDYLNSLLHYHQNENILSHIKSHDLVKGDVTKTVSPYLDSHPEMIVALAIFDMALYEPTKHALEAIKPRLIKGSIIAFDELNCADYPGETMAFREVFGADKFTIKRSKFLPDRCYIIME